MVWNRLMAYFRRKFSATSHASLGLPRLVEPRESITRFLHSSEHFAATTGRVKGPAIAPRFSPTSGQFETSVYRAIGAASKELWDICSARVDQPATQRIMKARGTCSAQAMFDEKLTFDADGRPHPRHANVVAWPDAKNERKIVQQKIAASMTLEIRP